MIVSPALLALLIRLAGKSDCSNKLLNEYKMLAKSGLSCISHESRLMLSALLLLAVGDEMLLLVFMAESLRFNASIVLVNIDVVLVCLELVVDDERLDVVDMNEPCPLLVLLMLLLQR